MGSNFHHILFLLTMYLRKKTHKQSMKKKVLVRKQLTPEKIERLEQIILKQKNLYSCINSTGVRHSTIKRMFATGLVRADLLAKIEKFCNSVEPKTK